MAKDSDLLLAKSTQTMETSIVINKTVRNDRQVMTSLEIAQVTGKQHKNLMRDIRNMEPAWEKVQGLKFELSSRTYNLPNGGTKIVPCYILTKPHRYQNHIF